MSLSLIRSAAVLGRAMAATGRYNFNEIVEIMKFVQTPGAAEGPAPEPVVVDVKPEPVISVKKSITPEYLICLLDGKRFKSLKKHLSTLGYTPQSYRAAFGLPVDYPMVAPNYAARRSEIAKGNGLGRRPAEAETPVHEAAEAVEIVVESVVETIEVGADIPANDSVETVTTVAQEILDAETDPKIDEAQFVSEGTGSLPDGYMSIEDTFTNDGKFICLLDGKSVSDLGRHARRHHGVSADAYRARFGLPSDYPMTAEVLQRRKAPVAA